MTPVSVATVPDNLAAHFSFGGQPDGTHDFGQAGLAKTRCAVTPCRSPPRDPSPQP